GVVHCPSNGSSMAFRSETVLDPIRRCALRSVYQLVAHHGGSVALSIQTSDRGARSHDASVTEKLPDLRKSDTTTVIVIFPVSPAGAPAADRNHDLKALARS